MGPIIWILLFQAIYVLFSTPAALRYLVAVNALRIVALPLLFALFFISKRVFDWTMLFVRWPHQDIVLEGRLYLRRYYLSPPSWRRKLFLHHIVLPDSGRDPHSHPWAFRSLILSGGYRELVVKPNKWYQSERSHWIGNLVNNPLSHVHRVLSVRPNTWTLVLTGAAAQVWGFWVPASPGKYDGLKFVSHHDYLNVGESEDWAEDRIQN